MRTYTRKPSSHSKGEEMRKRILAFIFEYLARQLTSPTIREICEAVNLSSSSSAHSHLNKLVELGLLERIKNRYRPVNRTTQEAERCDRNPAMRCG